MYKKWNKNKNINNYWDTIIIGSGLSGLTTAAILARKGKKVLVLEAHDRPGGCLHTFSKHKVHFSTGNHYVGLFDKDMNAVWNFITQNKCPLTPSKETIVETFYDNDTKHELKVGPYEWYKTMKVNPKKVEQMADRMKWFVFFKVLPYYIAYFLWLIFWLIYPNE
jgi:phytoene dehydrogenase-like protein